MSARLIFALLRMTLSWIFLWAFFDKLIGLGFATCRDRETGAVTVMCEKAWLAGGSPTTGFLRFAAKGPFVDFYHSLAGSAIVDWLFMMGLLGVGVALLLGILTRLAVILGVLLMVLMYLALLPPENNPVADEHIIYALVLALFFFSPEAQGWGLGRRWAYVTRHNSWLA